MSTLELAVSIRPARPHEIPLLRRLGIEADRRFVEAGHPELADGATLSAAVAQVAIRRNRMFVAEVEGQIAGFVYLERAAEELCIAQISVATAFGRRGVGSTLLGAVIADAARRGEPSIVLNTQTDVPWNRRWYERHGFVVVPEEQWNGALRAITRVQTESGLDWSTRVHMRLLLRTPHEAANVTPS